MGAPKENINAEKWSFEKSESIFNEALDLSVKGGYDFIGEIARDLGLYRDIFTYLKDKYDDLKPLYKRLNGNLEANCFSHGKEGTINTAMAIVNLKSNHNWTDRTSNDLTTKGEAINIISLGEGVKPNDD